MTGSAQRHELLAAGLAALGAGLAIGYLETGAAAAFLVLGLAAVACVRPDWLVYGVVLAAPLHVYRVPVGPGNLSLFRVLVLLLGVGLAVRWLLGRVRVAPGPARTQLVLWASCAAGFLAYEALVALPRSETALGLTSFRVHVFFAGAVLLVAFALVTGVVRRSGVVIAVLASAVPQLLVLAWQTLTGGEQRLPFPSLSASGLSPDIGRVGVSFGEGFRPAATFSDPNFFAVFAAMTFILADETAKRATDPAARVALMALRLALVAGILVSLSRTGFAIVAVYLVVTRLRDLRLPRLGRSLGALAVCGLVLVVFLKPYLSVEALEARVTDPTSTAVHQETRRVAFEQGSANVLTGIGLANLGPLLGQPPDRSSAHSQPFTLFAEEGLIGLLLASLAVGLPAAAALRRRGLRGTGIVIGLAVAVWAYDFLFVLDVSAIWVAMVIAAGVPPPAGEAGPRGVTATP